MAFPRPQQKWVRKPSFPSSVGTHVGQEGQPRKKGKAPICRMLSPHPTSRPFLPTFLIVSGLTGATSVLGDCSFWKVWPVPFYSWGYWGRKWVIAVLRLWSSGALHCEATSSLRPAPPCRAGAMRAWLQSCARP